MAHPPDPGTTRFAGFLRSPCNHPPVCSDGTSALGVLFEKLQNRFACSDVSWRCRKLLKKSTSKWMRRIHRFSIWGTHISSAKRRAGACALFRFALGTQSIRVWSMDGTTRPSRNVVPMRLGNRLSAMLIVLSSRDWPVIRVVQHKCYHPHEFSLPSLQYVLQWMGEDAFDDLCFHPPWVQSFVCFALQMNPLGVSRSSWTNFEECESSKTPCKSQLIRAERSSNGS